MAYFFDTCTLFLCLLLSACTAFHQTQHASMSRPSHHGGLSRTSATMRSPPSPSSLPSRREMLLQVSVAALAGQTLVQPAAALDTCPKGAKNCYSTASPSDSNKIAVWEWPKGMDRTAAISSLRGVVDAYPQEGQDGVDGGGWSYVADGLTGDGYAKLEFKSSGKGNLARFFNGGKAFTDDFEIMVESSSVCIRSSARVGDSDFGVNAKRVNYIASGLEKAGWNAPGVKAF